MPVLDMAKRVFRSRAATSSVIVATLSLVLVVSFQNCGKAGFDSANDATLASVNPATNAPFAYEAAVDMVTYNSCNTPNSQGKTYNFMVGSYDSTTSAAANVGDQPNIVAKSGVAIRPEFINYAYEVLKPDFPNSEIVASQVQKLLTESNLNKQVSPQLSVRSIYKSLRLNNVFSKSNTPTIGIDVLPTLGDLANATWAEALLLKSFPKKSKIEYTNFFGGAENAKTRLEGAFHFNTNEQTAEDYRNAFNKVGNIDAQIVLGFSYEGEGVLIGPTESTGDVMSSAYGRGYQLTFSNPTVSTGAGLAAAWTYHPNNVLTKVEEFNLETNQAVQDTNWECGLKLKVVRQEDADFEWNSLVLAVNNAVTVDSSIAADQKEARKVSIVNENAAYYGYTGGSRAGLCPKMNYFTLLNVPPQTSVYGYGAYAGKTYAQILDIVRRHLPASDWDVNLEVGKTCAVPKKFSCYPDQDRKPTESGSYYGKFKVAKTVTEACYHQFDASYAAKANRAPASVTDWCNEFVSVCTKR